MKKTLSIQITKENEITAKIGEESINIDISAWRRLVNKIELEILNSQMIEHEVKS